MVSQIVLWPTWNNSTVALGWVVPIKCGSRTAVISSPLIPVSSFGSRLKLPGADGFARMIVKVAEPLPGLVPLLLLATASTVNVPDWFVGLGNVKVNVPVTGSAGRDHLWVKRSSIGLKQLNSRTGRCNPDEIGRGDICVSRCTGDVVGRQFQSGGYRWSRCRNAGYGECELKRHRVT